MSSTAGPAKKPAFADKIPKVLPKPLATLTPAKTSPEPPKPPHQQKTPPPASATPPAKQIDTSTLRGNVTSKGGEVWEHRHDTDAYTGKSRKETLMPEVDHVVEIQILDTALSKAVASLLGGSGTKPRSSYKKAADIANGLSNLNVTTHTINQKKKGPFSAFLHQYDPKHEHNLRPRALDQLCRTSHPDWAAKPEWQSVWTNITKQVVASYDDMQGQLHTHDDKYLTQYADELATLLKDLGLE